MAPRGGGAPITRLSQSARPGVGLPWTSQRPGPRGVVPGPAPGAGRGQIRRWPAGSGAQYTGGPGEVGRARRHDRTTFLNVNRANEPTSQRDTLGGFAHVTARGYCYAAWLAALRLPSPWLTGFLGRFHLGRHAALLGRRRCPRSPCTTGNHVTGDWRLAGRCGAAYTWTRPDSSMPLPERRRSPPRS
jgi:hypothetical protein